MPYRYKVKETYVQISWFGVMTAENLADFRVEIPELIKKEGRRLNLLQFFDRVERVAFEPMEAYRHSIEREDVPMPYQTKSASVAHKPSMYALARVFEELNRNPTLEMRVFETEAAAKAWLAEA